LTYDECPSKFWLAPRPGHAGAFDVKVEPAPVLQEQETPSLLKPPRLSRRRPAPFAMIQTRNGTSHLFDSWEHVSKRVRAAVDIRIFLDFDGTLVRYYDRPEDVKLTSKCRRILERLSRHRRVHLAIVSGRRNAALRKYVRVPRLKLLGLFGWEKRGRPALPRKTSVALRRLRSALAPLPASFPGIHVENKGISIAVHFRGAPPEAQRSVRIWIRGLLKRIRGPFGVIQSNHSCEIVPRQVKGKGVAMREFTRGLRTPFLPIYVGDDLTDEPAFLALRRGITVRVGPVSRTKARFRLRNPGEVCAFLERLEEELS
jgi:trehalose 6-phosphate phosphatase